MTLAAQFAHDMDLPTGHHLIEASAGTGKTFALVGLAARFLAEGRTTASGLLLVTFSRASTRELRTQLLERLTGADRLLRQALAGETPGATDPVDDALLDASPRELRARAVRIRQALRELDTATITTIHGLCADLLRRTGEGLDTQLAEIDDVMVDQLLADVVHRLVRAFPHSVQRLPDPRTGRNIVRAALSAQVQDLLPPCDQSWLDRHAGVNGCLAKAAHLVAVELRAAAREHTYDDLLNRLEERLAGPAGAAAVDTSRPLYQVGLVDEFQDTDPTQWTILSHLFPGDDGRALVMVGDPKQSIYSFRGADVDTYLRVRGERAHHTLSQNWRADGPVVRAGSTLFRSCDLGEGISVHRVTPMRPIRLHPNPPAIHLRVVTDAAPTPRGKYGVHLVGPTRELIAADVAAHAVELLHDGYEVDPVPGPDDDGPPPRRELRPEDITVLVRTNAQAAMVQRQLGLRGVPSVLNGVGNVLKTRAARDWLGLLRALHQPSRGGPARLAALTDLLPRSLAVRDDGAAERLHVRLHELAGVLERDGVAALIRALDEDGMTERLIGTADGTRRLVDLQHVGELIHGQARAHGLGLVGLITWLEQAMATAGDVPPEAHARRLADAGSAVEVMTAHSAKGLERGIVLAPYLWDPPKPREDVVRFVDEHDHRRVDVGGKRSSPVEFKRGRNDRMARAHEQQQREEMRLAYVAVTRARHHVVLWWGSAGEAASSPLAGMLGCAGQADAQLALDGGMALAAEDPDLFKASAVESVPADTPWRRPTPVADEALPELVLAKLDREIDRGWRRTSYSGLMRAADERRAAQLRSDAALPGATDDWRADVADEASEDVAEPPPSRHPEGHESPEVVLSTMPGGAEVGSAIHAVLEHLDFTAEDLPAAIDGLLDTHLRATSIDLADESLRARIVEGLAGAVRTPVVGGTALVDLGMDRRFDELAFEIPVLDGTAAPGTATLGHVADLLDAHLPADDPLAGYAEHLRDSHAPIEMRGYLTGFIDLLARMPDGEFLVADYKTNRLGDGPQLREADHDTASMAAAMVDHHYPIQAMLYLVAAHRFLRWRVPGYDVSTDLIGSAYLFLRGMTGAPQPDGSAYGVMLWQPPADLIVDLDGLLARGMA